MRILKFARKTIEFVNHKAFNFVEGFLLSDSPRMIFSMKTINMSYEILNQKRIVLELKRTKAQLSGHYKIKEGSLLRTKVKMNARSEISRSEYKTDWVEVPENVTLMFLGVEHDHNYDAVTLKVLWEQKLYYIHKNANFKDFSTDFRDKFEVLL